MVRITDLNKIRSLYISVYFTVIKNVNPIKLKYTIVAIDVLRIAKNRKKK